MPAAALNYALFQLLAYFTDLSQMTKLATLPTHLFWNTDAYYFAVYILLNKDNVSHHKNKF
jgi:Mg2+/citrate symporter